MAKLNQDLLLQLEGKMVETKVLKLKVNGKSIDIKVEKKFLNTKIEKLITELLELNQYITEQNLEGLNIATMVFVMMFKTFTDIPYIENGTLEEKLENYIHITNALRNLECEDGESVFEKVINEFSQDQIEKINNKMRLMTKNITEFVKSEQDKAIVEGNQFGEKNLVDNIVGNLISEDVNEDASI